MARSEQKSAEAAGSGRDTASRSAPSRRRGPGWLVLALVIVVTVAVVLVGQRAMDLLPDWANPFGEQERDRSGPVVLKSIRDLARFEAASGNFQVIVDLERDAKFLPDAVRGQRTLFVGHGSVDALAAVSAGGPLMATKD